MIILDNSSSDGEACSDVDEDCSIVDDSLLGNSVDFANGTSSTPHSKRQRSSGVQFREPTTRTPVANQIPAGSSSASTEASSLTQAPTNTRSTANPPTTMSVTNTGHNTVFLTSSDGNAINMGDVMNAMMMQIHSVNKLVSKQEESETTRKRRLEETEVLLFGSNILDISFSLQNEEETPILVEGMVSDNAHDKISWDIRSKLRPLNISPAEMYKDRRVPTCVRPVLGRSLLTNHRMPYCINECTTKKRHDLLKSIPVHHYSQKNGLALSRGERVMKFKDQGSSSKDLLMTDSPSWEPHTTVSELIDSLMAWQSLDHIIHPTHYGTDVIVWICKKVIITTLTPFTTIYFSCTTWGQPDT